MHFLFDCKMHEQRLQFLGGLKELIPLPGIQIQALHSSHVGKSGELKSIMDLSFLMNWLYSFNVYFVWLMWLTSLLVKHVYLFTLCNFRNQRFSKICEIKDYPDFWLTLFADEFNFKFITKKNSRDLSKETEVICCWQWSARFTFSLHSDFVVWSQQSSVIRKYLQNFLSSIVHILSSDSFPF